MSSKTVGKPSRFWTGFLYVLLWPLFRIRYNLKIDKSNIKGLKGPYVLLCNHAQGADPFFVYGALYPQLVSFVGGYNHFNNPILRPFLKKLGAIPKFQYQIDLKAMKDMLTVIKRGGNLGIFPAGRNSSCGEGFYIPEAIAKLLKLCKVKVISCHIDGSYLVKPKWAKTNRRGPIYISFKEILSADDVKNFTDAEITEVVNDALSFNDYKFNEDRKIHYKGKDLAVGLETTCYRCPKCDHEFTFSSSHNHLTCKHCETDFELLDTGFFKENPYYKNPFEWFEDQRRKIDKELDKDILIEDDVICKMNLEKGLTEVGSGHCLMNQNEIVYKGEISGEDKELIFPLEELMSLPYRAGVNFEIADATNIYQFKLKNGLAAAKWCQLVEQLYKRRNLNK